MNLLQLPSKDANAYGRNLLDILFTKSEQARSVVVPIKKSDKPPLSPPRVQILFGKLHWQGIYNFLQIVHNILQIV